MRYKDLLKHPKWQKKRLKILERDNFTCQACRDTKTMLHVHHWEYHEGMKPWEYKDEEMITLCSRCHDILHHLNDFQTGYYLKIIYCSDEPNHDIAHVFYGTDKYLVNIDEEDGIKLIGVRSDIPAPLVDILIQEYTLLKERYEIRLNHNQSTNG